MTILGVTLPLLHIAVLTASLAVLLYLSRGIFIDVRGGDTRTRMKRHLSHVIDHDRPATESVSEDATAIVKRRRGRAKGARTWLGRSLLGLHERIQVIGGRSGVTLFYGGPIVAACLVLAGQQFVRPWSPLYDLPVALSVAAVTTILLHRILERRFELLFLNDFPDALDLIVRAVRAGVPVAQAIQVASQELNEPVRTEFKSMADSLRLGADMADVLKEATTRIRVSDFNFFAVCILLQRETGGQLAETLENLARIIRSRRDLRLKAKALVAEGRAASKAIGAIPFLCLGFLYLVNEDYVTILFTTPTGRKMMLLAAAMLAIGFIVINRISQLEE